MLTKNEFFAAVILFGVLIVDLLAVRTRLILKPEVDLALADEGATRRILAQYVPYYSNHTIVLRGHTDLGYYYATLFFGSPPQKQTVIVDTGSSITVIPCKGCQTCGPFHMNKKFDPERSQWYGNVSCIAKIGNYACRNCSINRCQFYIGYTEGSIYEGSLSNDIIVASDEIEEFFYGDSQKSPNDILFDIEKMRTEGYFVCLSREGGHFLTQQADGIIGLGANTNTQANPPNFIDMISQEHGERYKNSFSICLSGYGGYLTIGGQNKKYFDNSSKPIYVRYYNSGQYQIRIHKLSVKPYLRS